MLYAVHCIYYILFYISRDFADFKQIEMKRKKPPSLCVAVAKSIITYALGWHHPFGFGNFSPLDSKMLKLIASYPKFRNSINWHTHTHKINTKTSSEISSSLIVFIFVWEKSQLSTVSEHAIACQKKKKRKDETTERNCELLKTRLWTIEFHKLIWRFGTNEASIMKKLKMWWIFPTSSQHRIGEERRKTNKNKNLATNSFLHSMWLHINKVYWNEIVWEWK